MEVKATQKGLRIAPRKVRLVIDAVRGLSVEKAKRQLRFINKASAEPVLKLINSAVANAEQKNIDVETLIIKSIIANPGPIMYRYRPRAMGRAATIRKRTTHVVLTLDGDVMAQKAKETKKSEAQEVGENVSEKKKAPAKKKTT